MVAPMLEPEIRGHYDEGVELRRLSRGAGALELARTQDILRRHLPQSPATVLDVGGGPGIYAAWLNSLGYTVQLVDPVPSHVEEARRRSVNAEVGDARSLSAAPESADAVLLLGPLYHLTERADRLLALREAARVVRPGGLVFAVGISRFASLLDGLRSHYLDDPAFRKIVDRDLRDGQHRNPENRPGWFTTAFFHHPDELAREIVDAGLDLQRVVAIEGPLWLFPDLAWEDEGRRGRLLDGLRAIEEERSLMGASAHFMGIASRL